MGGHDSVASRYPFLVGKEWIDLPTAYPSQIQPQLFLGSDSPARDRRVFEHLNIGAVVNAARELPNFLEGDEALALSYLNMNWDDDPLQEIASGIEKALPFISTPTSGTGSASALQNGPVQICIRGCRIPHGYLWLWL